MKYPLLCAVLGTAVLAACGQAGPLVLPDKNVQSAAPTAVPPAVVPALPGLSTPPPTETPATTPEPNKEQP